MNTRKKQLKVCGHTDNERSQNELLQINNTKECIKVKKVGDRLHYSYMAVPKGRDVPEEFYISKQSMELIQSVARMLKSHYNSDFIPQVSYRNKRKHLFPVPKPYYLQYHNQSFGEHAVRRHMCNRFCVSNKNVLSRLQSENPPTRTGK